MENKAGGSGKSANGYCTRSTETQSRESGEALEVRSAGAPPKRNCNPNESEGVSLKWRNGEFSGDYRFEGRQVYSNKSGKLVANLDGDGNPVMVKGMAGAHSRKLAEFLNGQREEANAPEEVPPEETPTVEESLPAGNTNVFVGTVPVGHVEKTAAPEEVPKTPDEFLVYDIPEADLPEFLPELGAESPEVKEFIRRYRLTARQSELLIRRCEKRR